MKATVLLVYLIEIGNVIAWTSFHYPAYLGWTICR